MRNVSVWMKPVGLALVTVFVVGVAVQGQRPEGQRAVRFEGRAPQPAQPGKPLTGPNAGSAVEIASRYVQQSRQALGLVGSDLLDVVISSHHTSEHNGVTHIYLAQRYQGIEVYGAQINVNILADGSVLSIGNSFMPQLARAVNRVSPATTAMDAVERAARHLGRTLTGPPVIRAEPGGPAAEVLLAAPGLARKDVEAKLVFQPVSSTEARLAWLLDIEETASADWWHLTVDAETGEVLGKDNLTDHDDWGPAPMMATDEPGTEPAPLTRAMLEQSRTGATLGAAAASMDLDVASLTGGSPNSVNDGSAYNVFRLPFESPNHGPRTLVTNPADALASPFGWHDTNGVAGPEFTRTRGNNVHAYTDIDANNIADPGSDPDGGPSLYFDFPLNLGLNPPTYRDAAVANLFYWNNIVHDVFYRYGLTEMAGNFQVNNYGRGPTTGNLGANDDVRAEAQDGSGTNNANFATPADGSRPRMQMFVWTYPFVNLVTVNSPAGIAGHYPATNASFGPQLTAVGPITANVVIALDEANTDGPSPTDGCSPLTNAAAVAGQIALVDRGSCPFTSKVFNAQSAGAVAVIVANNVPGAPVTMGFTAPIPTITIPSLMLSLDDADLIKANLPVNATVDSAGDLAINRDSDFDNGVIVHEYGHGISNRLTGGRTNVSCLGNQEQMGEGWSDWLGLVLTTKPEHTATTRRGIGTYVIYQPVDGNGIRPTPYTTDMTVNPSTYDTIKNPAISVPHGVGYVWATMLWDMYWNLVHKYGYNADVYGAWNTGGNNLAIQLVMDGMKLQPCQPGFVTGRNAILQADQALTGGVNQCDIWHAFARRGLGVSAAQGSSNNRNDGVQAFDVPAACVPGLSLASPAPTQYSDPVALSATVSPVWYYGERITGSVEFFIDGASVGASAIDASGVAALSMPNALAAGGYSLTATFTPTGPAGVPSSSAGPVALMVTKEQAATEYTGDEFVVTAGPNVNTAPVRLAATLTQEADGHLGDLSLARVVFELFRSNNMSSTPDVTVGDVPVGSGGSALVIASLGVDVWTVKVRVAAENTYWTASPVGMATVTVDLGSTERRVTGGGWVADPAGRNGKSNFGFTVSPQKNGSPRGNSVFVLRGVDGFDYIVKGTSWQGGGMSFSGNPPTGATFSGRTTVQKVDPTTGNVVASFGNYRFTVDLVDGDLLSPAVTDRYGITVLDAGGNVWHQVGAINAPVALGGGNVAIRGQ